MDDFISLSYSFANEDICKSVHPLIKLLPGDLLPFTFAGILSTRAISFGYNLAFLAKISPIWMSKFPM